MNSKNSAKVNELIDIRTIHIDRKLSQQERISSFVKQVKNPYHFRVGNVVVSVAYSTTDSTLDDRFSELLSAME